MKIENMKKDIDEFIRELFNGTTLMVLAQADEKKIQAFSRSVENIGKWKNNKYVKELNDGLLPNLDKYLEGNFDDQFIRQFYRQIILLRNYGFIVNNTDAIATLKIEKMYAERTSRQLAEENKLLAEELSAYKQFVALQGKTLTGIK